MNSEAEVVTALLRLLHLHIPGPAGVLDEGGAKKSADYPSRRNLQLDTTHLLHFAPALGQKCLKGHS